MNFKSAIFGLEMQAGDYASDAKTCEKEAAEAKRRLNAYDDELGNLIVEFNCLIKKRKEAEADINENMCLAKRFWLMQKEYLKAAEVLRAASD